MGRYTSRYFFLSASYALVLGLFGFIGWFPVLWFPECGQVLHCPLLDSLLFVIIFRPIFPSSRPGRCQSQAFGKIVLELKFLCAELARESLAWVVRCGLGKGRAVAWRRMVRLSYTETWRQRNLNGLKGLKIKPFSHFFLENQGKWRGGWRVETFFGGLIYGKRIRDASIYTSKKISLKLLFLSDIFLFPFIRQ